MQEHRQTIYLRIEDELAGVILAFMINPGSLPLAAEISEKCNAV
jgi:hypothetical protein